MQSVQCLNENPSIWFLNSAAAVTPRHLSFLFKQPESQGVSLCVLKWTFTSDLEWHLINRREVGPRRMRWKTDSTIYVIVSEDKTGKHNVVSLTDNAPFPECVAIQICEIQPHRNQSSLSVLFNLKTAIHQLNNLGLKQFLQWRSRDSGLMCCLQINGSIPPSELWHSWRQTPRWNRIKHRGRASYFTISHLKRD